MLALNISCPVCKVVFKKTDAIYSTSCGHIFHFFCMNQWRSNSSSCPQCRSYNPTTHSIYLNFEETSEYETIVNNLKVKLQQTDDKMKKLKEEVAKKDQRIDDLKRLYNISEQWRAELETKIYKLSHESQVRNVKHTKELNLKLDIIETLKTQLESMERAEGVYEFCDKLHSLQEENVKLKANIKEDEESKIVLNHKLEMQEQRLKHVTLELQKQIAESVNRSMDKTIPQPQTNETETNNKEGNQLQQPKNKRKNRDSRKRLSEKQEQNFDQAMDKTIRSRTPQEQAKILKNCKPKRQYELTQPHDTKVIIKDYPSKDLAYPLTNTVISLAAKMSLTLSSEDLSNVNILDQKGLKANNSNKIVLLVEFKTINGKIQFLSNRNRLKFNSSTKFIQLKEYIDETIYPLFMYANRLLRANGFEYIACKDNKVIAKKNRQDIEEIAIIDKNHVDRILVRQTLPRPFSYHSFDLFGDSFL